VMTFSDDYSTFEVLDFDKARRITGKSRAYASKVTPSKRRR
jgi:hypothetical protein